MICLSTKVVWQDSKNLQDVPDQTTRMSSPRSPLPLLLLPPVPILFLPPLPLLFSCSLFLFLFLMSFPFWFSRWYWTLATPQSTTSQNTTLVNSSLVPLQWAKGQSSVWPNQSVCPSGGPPSKMYLPSSQRCSSLFSLPSPPLSPLSFLPSYPSTCTNFV